jgi:hypothetical protein
VCGWALITAWDAISSGHPSYVIFYGAAALIGLGSIFQSVRRSRKRGMALSVFGSVAILILIVIAFWLRPFSADAVAVEALANPSGYEVTTNASMILLDPVDDKSHVGLVFQPGARVDARAYAAVLAGVVAEGHPVVIVKQPLGIGFLALGSIPDLVAGAPSVEWVAAGHSLGGVAASEAAEGGIAGLVLWASYPAGNISAMSELDVSSVFGTADAITTVADIEESKERLPPQTSFIPIDGGIHSFFGDYGLQPGDGTPSAGREEAQSRIVAATVDLLERVKSGG